MNYHERRLALDLEAAEGEVAAWQRSLDHATAACDLEGAHVVECEAVLRQARDRLWTAQTRHPRITGTAVLVLPEGALGREEAAARAARAAAAQAEAAQTIAAQQLALWQARVHELRQQLGLPEAVTLKLAPAVPVGGEDDPPSGEEAVPAAESRRAWWRLS